MAVQVPALHDWVAEDYLKELRFLTETAGAQTQKIFTQRLPNPHPKTYIGKGKLEEIQAWVTEMETDIAIFDDELSPAQIRNLEESLKIKVIDRPGLILDIFARHARTAQARTQVDLAQNQYLLPRLTRMWTHLQKQKGGIGMKGPGEKEIETDRRAIRNRISLLKEKLQDIDKTAQIQRKNRSEEIRIALVGYTNVGKSTLMNLLSKSEVLAENKLFATLDTTVRQINLEGQRFLLSDTVGFIRKLPHHLVECFKSTLDEVREADILMHVVDISHPAFEDQMRVVEKTLMELGVADKPVMVVFNKCDQLQSDDPFESPNEKLKRLEKTWMARFHHPVSFISATQKMNIEKVRAGIILMASMRRQKE